MRKNITLGLMTSTTATVLMAACTWLTETHDVDNKCVTTPCGWAAYEPPLVMCWDTGAYTGYDCVEKTNSNNYVFTNYENGICANGTCSGGVVTACATNSQAFVELVSCTGGGG